MIETAKKIAADIQRRKSVRPDIGLVLGSGGGKRRKDWLASVRCHTKNWKECRSVEWLAMPEIFFSGNCRGGVSLLYREDSICMRGAGWKKFCFLYAFCTKWGFVIFC